MKEFIINSAYFRLGSMLRCTMPFNPHNNSISKNDYYMFSEAKGLEMISNWKWNFKEVR